LPFASFSFCRPPSFASIFVVVLLFSVFFLTSFSLVSSFCHSFFYIFLPSFTAYFNLSFCSNPPSRHHFVLFRNKISERYQIPWTSNRNVCRSTSPLRSPLLSSTLQSTDVHNTDGITKGVTQSPSRRELRPGTFCASLARFRFLK